MHVWVFVVSPSRFVSFVLIRVLSEAIMSTLAGRGESDIERCQGYPVLSVYALVVVFRRLSVERLSFMLIRFLLEAVV